MLWGIFDLSETLVFPGFLKHVGKRGNIYFTLKRFQKKKNKKKRKWKNHSPFSPQNAESLDFA
ncbi:MAG: hypothetical protein IJ468_14830 [Lachnospiraceae bacterium]|nr:hypothetical protein [Lachnospiraceae bacterium]